MKPKLLHPCLQALGELSPQPLGCPGNPWWTGVLGLFAFPAPAATPNSGGMERSEPLHQKPLHGHPQSNQVGKWSSRVGGWMDMGKLYATQLNLDLKTMQLRINVLPLPTLMWYSVFNLDICTSLFWLEILNVQTCGQDACPSLHSPLPNENLGLVWIGLEFRLDVFSSDPWYPPDLM